MPPPNTPFALPPELLDIVQLLSAALPESWMNIPPPQGHSPQVRVKLGARSSQPVNARAQAHSDPERRQSINPHMSRPGRCSHLCTDSRRCSMVALQRRSPYRCPLDRRDQGRKPGLRSTVRWICRRSCTCQNCRPGKTDCTTIQRSTAALRVRTPHTAHLPGRQGRHRTPCQLSLGPARSGSGLCSVGTPDKLRRRR